MVLVVENNHKHMCTHFRVKRVMGDGGCHWQQTTPPSKTSVGACGGRWLVVAVANNTPPKTSVCACGGRWHRWVVVACYGWWQVMVAAAADDMPPTKMSTFACFRGWREMCVSQ
jgi:hypothetical protein